MIQFHVSAPGKVILFGEHSVVYGKTALAASLNLRTNLFFKEKHDIEEKMHIKFPQIEEVILISTQNVQNLFSEISMLPSVMKNEVLLHDRVEKFIDEYASTPQEKTATRFSKLALFYLLFRTFHLENVHEIPSFEIEVNSELKISSGLGSSASFAVCLATCFSQYCLLLKKKNPTLGQSRLEEISKRAFECEKIMHGSPSGIDNMICTFGSMLEFSKTGGMSLMPCSKDFKIVLVDSMIPRSTKKMVETVSLKKTKYPQLMESIFHAMDIVAKKAVQLISEQQTGQSEDQIAHVHDEISKLVQVNQGLLYACGVSNHSLDTICAKAQECGFSGKLTGAGGGGYAYIFISPFAPEEDAIKLSKALNMAGFTATLTTLGGSGVQIH